MLKENNFFFNKFKKFNKKTALITEDNNIISYKDLINLSQKISSKLSTKKKLVFLLGQNNLETIVAYLAFINKRHTVVMLDYKINKIFLNRLISIYKPSYIFIEKKKILKNSYREIFNFRSYTLFKSKKKLHIEINPDLMLLMSTSGSTGSPKLVRQSYENVLSNTQNIIKYLNINYKHTTITSLPISYVYGLSVINTHLFAGGKIVLTNSSMVEKKFWELVNNFKVNNFSGVPYNYSIIEKIFRKKIPISLKYSTQAGGKINEALLNKIKNIYKKNKLKLYVMYGAAEATSRMSYLNYNFLEKKLGSVGKPIPGGKFYLLDKNEKLISKSFEKGELIYKGKNVCMGYSVKLKDLSLPDLNKGVLKTGDIAYRDRNHFYYIVGRKNRYTKIYGIRVDLSELEFILSKNGIETYMKEGTENKIEVYTKNKSKIKDGINYISKITNIKHNVFIIKNLTEKKLTRNYKYKI